MLRTVYLNKKPVSFVRRSTAPFLKKKMSKQLITKKSSKNFFFKRSFFLLKKKNQKRNKSAQNLKWRKLKKPFWRRKSYRRVYTYNMLYSNMFKAYTNPSLRILSSKPSVLRGVKWFEYFNRNKVKSWFKKRIILRLVLMHRYGYWTHQRMFYFVKKLRNRTPTLWKFWKEFEFTLERYIIWWQFAPQYLFYNNVFFSRKLILNGYVSVNFLIVVNPLYIIKPGDCIFFLHALTPKNSFVSNSFLCPFKVKFKSRYRFKLLQRSFIKEKKQLFQKTNFKIYSFVKRYKWYKFLDSWNILYWTPFLYYFERSYKYRIIINLYDIVWSFLLFSLVGKFSIISNFYITNWFINKRYYG